ncbi:PREDICTED: uncharacterized protein LOC109239540 [Nicotiana attenuata]|uniref:uncharacterized protein LOC109239540 n=1 Tax=Nicotiana attenuata TaxID=49451 RepID=UPI000904FDB5|nr:PREDICTED: uncharacterized protein LOC109239540 [Nicotiana attenuata]
MKNFVVGPNNLKIKTSKHKLKLTFSHRKSVDEISDPQFSLNIFNFKPYEHLTNQLEVDENELFGVIGEVIGHGNVESYNQGGKTSTFMNLELEDHARNNISAIFWGEFIDEILPHLDGSPNQCVIVVMQLIKAHKFQGSGREVNFERISQTTSQRSYSVSEELALGNVKVKNIGELIDFMQEGQIWIVTTVVNLELKRDGHMLQVRIIDGISLLLWDREATKLIGKSADTLKEGVVETSGAAYECSHPLEIEAILDRKFMFKLTVKSSNIDENDEVYIVVKVSDDEDIIQKYSPSSEADTFTDPDFNNEQVTSGDTRDKDSMADNEMISPKRTPAKRTRDDDGATTVEVDDDMGQLSSNRVKRVIKRRKIHELLHKL